ncbi:MAG: GTPase Era [Myxococcota bacterium]
MSFRSGTVALVGRPNVGKSTLLNQLVGQKIAATTHKPQTTRKNLLGVIHTKDAELMLLDTPGYHRAEGPLNRFMVRQAEHAIADADVIGYLVEARADAEITPGNQALLDRLREAGKPVVVIVNKIDRLSDKTALLPQIERLREALGAALTEVVPISALKKNGFDRLIQAIAGHLPEGERVFEEGQLTDKSERQIVAEMVREKLILETQDELPYAAHVSVVDFQDERPRIVRIAAEIWVERPSQKAIVIGRGAERLKSIGTRARKDIEFLLDSKVFLELVVKVEEGWSGRPNALERFGYSAEALELEPEEDDGAREEILAHLAALEDVAGLEALDPPSGGFEPVPHAPSVEREPNPERGPSRHQRPPRGERPAPAKVEAKPRAEEKAKPKGPRRAHGNKGRVDAMGRPRDGESKHKKRWNPRTSGKQGGKGPKDSGPRGRP